MNKRTDRRKRIEMALDEFRAAVSRALGVAAEQHSVAAMEHAKAMVELWLREVGIDSARNDPHFTVALNNPAFCDVLERVEADWRREFAEWSATGPDTLTGIVATSAPGVAGAPSSDWLGKVGDADGTGVLPELWRIGTAVSDSAPDQVPFPVAIPLLDTSHLQISSGPKTRAGAEALVEGLLMRVLSYFLPGLVHVHVWDTGQFTGPLPGLYPLTRAGLLTVHDAARPEELLDELSEHIRRVHTGVLMGGHESIRAISGDAGRRTEPWRIAVLFGNHRPLKDEHQQQLQRIARNGLAVGVQLIVVDLPLTVNSPMELVKFTGEHTGTTSMSGEHATFTADPTLPRAEVPSACAAIAQELEERRARLCTFADLLPGKPWQANLVSRADRAGRLPRRRPGRRGARRLIAARADRRTERVGQDELSLRDARQLRRPLLPRRARALPAGLQGGRVVRPVHAWQARPQLAAARAAGRRERQRGPRVRRRHAALPRRRDAQARGRGQAARGHQAGGVAPGGSAGPLAPVGRGDRRVPVPVRGTRRGRERGGDAAGGRGAAWPVAGHPPGAGQSGRVRDRGVLGQARDLRAVHPAGRAAQGAPGAGRAERGGGGTAALARDPQPRVRASSRATSSAASRTRPAEAPSTSSRPSSGRRDRHIWTVHGCSTVRTCHSWPIPRISRHCARVRNRSPCSAR